MTEVGGWLRQAAVQAEQTELQEMHMLCQDAQARLEVCLRWAIQPHTPTHTTPPPSPLTESGSMAFTAVSQPLPYFARRDTLSWTNGRRGCPGRRPARSRWQGCWRIGTSSWRLMRRQ